MKIINGWICQVSGNSINPVFGDLIIENQKIRQIEKKDFDDYMRHPKKSKNGKDVLNAEGRAITLPLVNFHEHFYSRLAKGLNISGPTDNFLHILENLWWKLDMTLDKEMIRASVQMGALESIRNGVTYTFDHHASPAYTKGSLAVIAETLSDFNIRGVLCFETSDRNGPQKAQEALIENTDFYLSHCGENLKAMLGLHASFTVSDQILQESAKIVEKHNLGIHIHLCEGKADQELSLADFKSSPVSRLQKFGLINNKSILAHGIHLNSDDYETIAHFGSAIAYNPDSNLNNAVGLATFNKTPVEIPILSGTDGMHANPACSLKQLFLLHRHQGNSFETTFPWFQKIYFDQLHFVKRYFADFSELQTGNRADFVIWDYVPPTPFSADNFWGHYIYGILERPAQHVVHNGQFLMRDYQILNIDEMEISANIYKHGKRLFEGF
jgi:cytosine/adenosine deaminase-related metal-dependent hydrolase